MDFQTISGRLAGLASLFAAVAFGALLFRLGNPPKSDSTESPSRDRSVTWLTFALAQGLVAALHLASLVSGDTCRAAALSVVAFGEFFLSAVEFVLCIVWLLREYSLPPIAQGNVRLVYGFTVVGAAFSMAVFLALADSSLGLAPFSTFEVALWVTPFLAAQVAALVFRRVSKRQWLDSLSVFNAEWRGIAAGVPLVALTALVGATVINSNAGATLDLIYPDWLKFSIAAIVALALAMLTSDLPRSQESDAHAPTNRV